MENVLALAEKLGSAIAQHERFATLRALEKNVSDDKTASDIQSALEKQLLKISELERAGKPVEVADKHELERLQNAFRENEALRDLVKAQADYLEMMNKVNQTIVSRLQPTEQSDGD